MAPHEQVGIRSACQPCLIPYHVSGILSQNSEARLELAGLLGISYKCNYEASHYLRTYTIRSNITKREMNKFDKWISITYAERCDFDVTTNHGSEM